MVNELSLLERLAGWLESQGASVRSTHFSYDDGEATISAVIDLDNTEVKEIEGAKEYRTLIHQARTALDLDQQVLPSTLEVVAKNMAKTVMKLQRLARRRGPDYFFDLLHLVEKARGYGIQKDSKATDECAQKTREGT